MKKIILAIVIIGLVALAWVIWFKPAKHEAEEAKAETLVAVHVGKIERATLRAYVTAYGVVEPEPSGARPAASARVTPTVAGVITAVKCTEGQPVERGAVLVQLDSRLADLTVTFATQNMERQQKLVQTGGASQKALLETEQQLRAAQTQRDFLDVRAPLAGVVTRVNVKPGETVDLATTLAEIIDLDRLVVSASVPSAELALLQAGQSVEVRADAATAPIIGTLSYISPQVDPKAGTAPVRVALPANSALRPGQFVTFRIVCAEHKDCLAVPVESVVKTEDGGTVIAVVQDDKATQRLVTVGLRDGDLVEVAAAGLSAGQSVVTEGAYGLPKETKIRALNSATAESPVAARATSLELKQIIPLPDVKGGFDLMAADVAGQRLFVNAEDNDTTEVVDLAANKRIHTISGMHEPKWVVYRPESHKLYVANGDGAVRVVDSESFAPVGSIPFKEKANNLRYDPQTQDLFVGVGTTFGALGVVDTRSDSITARIALANYPKQFEIDGNLIYVNIPKVNHIAVVDRTKREVVATWPVKEAKNNVPMALDRANHRLFVGCESGKLVVFDTATGQSVASVDINADPDGIYCDSARQLVYVSCGAGFIDVLRQITADQYELVERIPTVKGAATSLFVPEWHKLILAVPQHEQQPAELRVFQTAP